MIFWFLWRIAWKLNVLMMIFSIGKIETLDWTIWYFCDDARGYHGLRVIPLGILWILGEIDFSNVWKFGREVFGREGVLIGWCSMMISFCGFAMSGLNGGISWHKGWNFGGDWERRIARIMMVGRRGFCTRRLILFLWCVNWPFFVVFYICHSCQRCTARVFLKRWVLRLVFFKCPMSNILIVQKWDSPIMRRK